MIYLLAQMLMALALAALCGGAIGWLIHRATHANQLAALRSALGRQKSQLEQARSDVAMLTDDYDDLHQRTQDEIETLRESNRQIPFLNTNLEKSQLLVRQMMQRHEAKIRDITTENQSLVAKLKAVEDRQQAYNKAQAELDSARRNGLDTADKKSQKTAGASNANADDEPGDTSRDTQAEFLAESHAETQSEIRNESHGETHSESQNETHSEIQNESHSETNGDQSHDLLAAYEPFSDTATENLAETIDSDVTAEATMEMDGVQTSSDHDADRIQFDQITLPDSTPGTGSPESAPVTGKISNRRNQGSWASAPLPTTVTNNAENAEEDESDPFDDVVEIGDELQRELDIEPEQHPLLDGSADRSSLFEPVEQQDDLKQIFGIGPVTEKALNNLGITSYSQLAELQQHEIETIANALEIVPGRIERDDWVGNARRQLEDVLEQL